MWFIDILAIIALCCIGSGALLIIKYIFKEIFRKDY